MAAELIPKPWRCEQGHALGQVVRNGSGVRVLLLYRTAIDVTTLASVTDQEMTDVDVIAVVEGLVVDVRCSICGTVRSWYPGREALRKWEKKTTQNT